MADVISSVVEVCVFRMEGTRPVFLLLQRSEGETLYPGLWQIVTGTIEPGEKAVDAARRELREETGVAPARFWIVPYTDAFYDLRRDAVNIATFFAAELPAGARVMLSPEHAACEWLSFEAACARLVWPGQRSGLEIVERYIRGGEEASRLITVPV